MTSENPNPEKPSAKNVLVEAKGAADKAASIADTANNAFSAIKWVAIAVVFTVIGVGGFGVYKAVSAPAKAIGSAADGMSDAVKSGASSVKDGTVDLINRLVIQAENQADVDRAAEAAFSVVTEMAATNPSGMKDRAFRLRNFPGHEGRVCEMSMQFGDAAIPVFIAADNKAYVTAKSLGAKTDRLMRVLIRAEGDDIAFATEWDEEQSKWVMKWKASTIKKPLSDDDAQLRLLSVLAQAARDCGK